MLLYQLSRALDEIRSTQIKNIYIYIYIPGTFCYFSQLPLSYLVYCVVCCLLMVVSWLGICVEVAVDRISRIRVTFF